MWKCLLWHTCVLPSLLMWCQERDSGHLQYKSCRGKHKISWQEEERAGVITAGGADSALKDRSTGAAVPRVPQGRCPQCKHAAWHGGQRLCLPSWWETRNNKTPHLGMLWPPQQAAGRKFSTGYPSPPGCGVPPLPAHPWHLEASTQTTSCAPHELPLFSLLPSGVSSSRGRDAGVSSPQSIVHGQQLPLGRRKGCARPRFQGEQREASSSCLT